jgi:glycosyltransferase involved in cell wall biosynthesis
MLEERGHAVTPFAIQDKRNIYPDKDFPRGLDLENASALNIFHFLYSREARSKLRMLLDSKQFDIAHLHIYYGQLSSSILEPLRDAGIPIVQTLHDFKAVCANSALMANSQFCDDCAGQHHWRAVVKRCNRGSIIRSAVSATEAYFSQWLGAVDLVDQFITVSDYQKNQLVRLGLPEKKITTIYHSVQGDNLEASKGEYFLFVGRLVKEKGIYDLLTAYQRLGKDAPPLKIVGDGPEQAGLMQLLADTALNVEMLGQKSGDELKKLYRNAICLINPSRYNETFGLTLIESYACGKPVIASRKGGMVEVVVDGKSGFLFTSGAIDEIAERMQYFIDQPDKAIEMGRFGRGLVDEKFNPDTHFTELMQVYKKAVR